MSRGRRYVGVAVGALLLLFAGVWWLAHSTAFPGWALTQWLPAGGTVAAVRGSLASGLQVEGLQLPGLRIERLALAVDWPRSLLGTPTVGFVDASGIRVDPSALPSAPANESAPSATWPSAWPHFSVGPLTIRSIEIAGARPIRLELAEWQSLQSRAAALTLNQLNIRGPEGMLALSGTVGAAEASSLTGEFRVRDYAGALQLSGTPAALAVTLSLQAPFPVALSGEIRSAAEAPSADLRLSIPRLSGDAGLPAPLAPLLPLAAELRLRADATALQLDGPLTLRGQALQLDGTRLRIAAERLHLEPLQVAMESTRLELAGDWPLAAAQRPGQLGLKARGLRWPGAPLELATLEAALSGHSDAVAFQLSGVARSATAELPLRGAGRWDPSRLELESLSLGEGALRAQAAWQAESGAVEALLSLNDFDAALLLPEHPGRWSGEFALTGVPARWQLALREVAGEWRGLPVTLAGALDWDGLGLPTGALEARLAGNLLQLRPVEGGQLATLEVVEPSALLPGARAQGRVELRQTGTRLDWRLALDQAEIPTASRVLTLERLEGSGDLLLDDGPRRGALSLRLAGLRDGDAHYGPLALDLRGDPSAHLLTLAARLPQGQVDLRLQGALEASDWVGTVETASISPEGLTGPPLALERPLALSLRGGRLALQRGCLRREAATVCLDGSFATAGVDPGVVNLDLAGLEVGALAPADTGWRVAGELTGRATLAWAGPALTGLSAELTMPALQWTLERDDGDRTLRIDGIRLTAEGAPERLAVRAQAELQEAGPLSLRLEGLGGPTLDGELQVDFAQLGVLDGWTPEVVNPQGRLQGRLTLRGPRDALDIGGELTLSELRTELPGAGLRVRDGRLSLRFPDIGVAALQGEIDTGEGALRLEARAQRDAQGQPQLSAQLRGERVLVADLPNLRLLASPAVQLDTRDGVLMASGTLGLPEGRIDLERFEPGVAASSDVVVLDRPVATPAPIRTDIRYTLGPALQLKGFGLDATLRGGLRVRSRPGRPVIASGTLDLAGGYRAYGQKLTIDRGRLLWANAPIGNPGFDFSAYRTIDTLKAGVRVRGSASAPELTVYTDPPREASDALSWLVLGRPLSSASGNDGQQLSAAAGALGSVGGALIGATIGQRLGVEINVESSAELGGSPAFTVGKMLSPKLFVGFGRSLFDSAQLVIVRYRLTEHYELEALSGRESKIGANYRLER